MDSIKPESLLDQALGSTILLDHSSLLRSTPVSTESEENAASEGAASTRDVAAYVLDSVIGRGGFGEVWAARQVSLDRRVAVKRLKKDIFDGLSAERVRALELAFEREALVTGWLDHPGIVPIYDLGLDQQGAPILAMKLVDGTPWSTLLVNDAVVGLAQVISTHIPVLIKVAQAAAFAHSRGIVHRDLKPNQVVVGKYGEVFLSDWGLAVAYADTMLGAVAPPFAVPVDKAPNPAGTPGYMAPEQTFTTGEKLGPWTDVFQLGGILYQLLTGTPPYPQSDRSEALKAAAVGDVEPPEQRAPARNIPRPLSSLAMRCLAADPRNRSFLPEFIRELERYLYNRSREEESLKIAAEAEERLAKSGNSYEELTELEHLVTSAVLLWGENQEAQRLKRKIMLRLVRAAITAGDLTLAAMHAQKLPGREDSLMCLEEIKNKRSTSVWKLRRLKLASVLLGASTLLLLVLVIFLLSRPL